MPSQEVVKYQQPALSLEAIQALPAPDIQTDLALGGLSRAVRAEQAQLPSGETDTDIVVAATEPGTDIVPLDKADASSSREVVPYQKREVEPFVAKEPTPAEPEPPKRIGPPQPPKPPSNNNQAPNAEEDPYNNERTVMLKLQQMQQKMDRFRRGINENTFSDYAYNDHLRKHAQDFFDTLTSDIAIKAMNNGAGVALRAGAFDLINHVVHYGAAPKLEQLDRLKAIVDAQGLEKVNANDPHTRYRNKVGEVLNMHKDPAKQSSSARMDFDSVAEVLSYVDDIEVSGSLSDDEKTYYRRVMALKAGWKNSPTFEPNPTKQKNAREKDRRFVWGRMAAKQTGRKGYAAPPSPVKTDDQILKEQVIGWWRSNDASKETGAGSLNNPQLIITAAAIDAAGRLLLDQQVEQRRLEQEKS